MKIAYIVVQKNGKKRCFSLKMARIVKKCAVFGENRAKSAIFSGFWREILTDSENRWNQPFFSKSLPKKFENYWIRGRVKSIAHRAIKTKNRYLLRGVRS